MFQDATETMKQAAEKAGDQGPDVQIGGDGPVIGHGLLDTLDNIWHFRLLTVNNAEVHVSNLVIALIVLIVGYLLARTVSAIVGRRWLPKLRIEQAAVHTIQRLLFYLMLTIVVLFALQFAGVPLTALTFLGGAIALGIGFGSQNVINNFISGLILLIERPIKVGELVTVEDQMGTILSIGARATLIHSYMGATYIVPNSKILENSVTNWHRPERKLKSIVGVGGVRLGHGQGARSARTGDERAGAGGQVERQPDHVRGVRGLVAELRDPLLDQPAQCAGAQDL